jgi:hypothetical protein
MTADQVRQKFRSNAGRALPHGGIAALQARVLDLETLPDVGELLDLSAPRPLDVRV